MLKICLCLTANINSQNGVKNVVPESSFYIEEKRRL